MKRVKCFLGFIVLAAVVLAMVPGGPVFAAALNDKAVTVGGSRATYSIYDEDTMSSDSATGFATQQSIKAYVGATAVDLAASTATAYTAAWSETANTNGYTVTVADDTFAAGQAYRFTFTGNKSATNAIGNVALYVDDAEIAVLHVAAATSGDFSGWFILQEYTDWAHQLVYGSLQCATAADGDADNSTDTTNFAGGAVSVAVRITSGHASDTMTIYSVLVEKLP